MEKITRSKLVELLKALPKSNTFMSVMTTTEPKMRKTGNPWLSRGVKKTATVTGCLHFNYENNVNAQRAREDKSEDFVVQARTWGQRVGDTCLIEHKGNMYLEYRALRCLRSRYFSEGKRIAKSVLDAWLYKSGGSVKQDLRKDIVVRTPRIENIRRININKKKYEVVDN